jgi:transposase
VAREHHQVLYGCKNNKCDANVARAPKPAQPIERGIPGAGLLAHVIVSRFDDHLPYYRQEQMFARQGVAVSRRSMSRWMYFSADLLEPIVEHMQSAIMGSRRIHTDDTGLTNCFLGNDPEKWVTGARHLRRPRQRQVWSGIERAAA